ncbi:MAG: ROK family transcriptional regulator [Actinobacteria bacterium]|nr:ROK family transcriptional regulator [Actinomycetota bacterium]
MIYRKEKNNISLKEINKKNILKIVIEMSPISRIDISRQLKISRPTTSTYIGELIEEGLVKEIGKGESTSSGGKKAVLLQFNVRAGYILGAMIGVKTIRIAITDLGSNIMEIIKVPTEEWFGPDAVIGKLVKNLKKIINTSKVNKEEIIGIGIGATGLVDSKKGLVIFSPNLDGWNNIKLKEIVEEKIGLTTFIENECRVQAIAENKYGLAKDVKNFVCVETGTGIGTGVFIDNKLMTGDKGMAGEVGHIITDLAGDRMCHCGNTGCIETLCSISSLIENIMADIRKSGKFVDYGGRKLKMEDLYRLYEHGDKIVTGNVEKNAEYLGIGISNTIKMFNPELIIIHGEIIKFGNKYLSKVRESVSKKTFPKVKDNYNIQFSKLGENVGLIGATSVVFNSIFDLDSSSVAGHYIIKKIIN